MKLTSGWIFSPRADIAVFLCPPALGFLLYACMARIGFSVFDPYWWAFLLVFVVGCDVVHCYATFVRTHLDPNEWRHRPHLLIGLPIAIYASLFCLSWKFSGMTMWYVLLYLAALHFVRQQIGWVSWTARRAGEPRSRDLKLDRLMIYNLTCFPLLVWHSGTLRTDWWEGMPFFAVVPQRWLGFLTAAYWLIIAVYVARQAQLVFRSRSINLAKYLIVFATWLNWYVGVLVLGTPFAILFAFTAPHSVPYIALVYRYFRKTSPLSYAGKARVGFLVFFAALLALGYSERALRNVLLDHQPMTLFPFSFVNVGSTAALFLIPLAALPTACHFVFDTYIWRMNRVASASLKDVMKF